jgi:uncharacterized protein involved in exopolysaccharide biosynthesis/Mrp family chromosome partitioning ATPase
MQQNINKHPCSQGSAISTVYYMLFRQKWKIILMGILGIVAAAGLWKISRTSYESEAKLLVRYVADSIATDPTAGGSQISRPDRSGRNIINSEIEILTSNNLIEDIVREMGPENFMVGPDDSTGALTVSQTAELVARKLRIEVPRSSNIIRIGFQAGAPRLAQEFLERLVQGYLEKHIEIHRDVGMYNFLSQQTDQLRLRLSQAEADLKKVKTASNLTSVDEDRAAIEARIEQLNRDMITAETEFAAAAARVKILRAAVSTPSGEQRNLTRDDLTRSASLAGLLQGLRSLRKKETELRNTYTEDSTLVKHVRGQIVQTQARVEELYASAGTTNAAGLSVLSPSMSGSSVMGGDPRESFLVTLQREEANLASLGARIEVLQGHAATSANRARQIEDAEAEFTRLTRQRDMTEETYRYFTAGLEHAKIDDALSSGKTANIAVVQPATMPTRAIRKDVARNMAAALMLCLGAGVGMAFFTEKIVDRSLRRPFELESVFGVPNIMSVPVVSRMRRFARGMRGSSLLLSQVPNAAADGTDRKEWEIRYDLKDYYETLRDRIFRAIGRNPPIPCIIGVTGCRSGSGVTTTAAGLAVALSQGQDGDVLLVDANLARGRAHKMFGVQPKGGMLDILMTGEGDTTLLQRNLSLLPAGDDNKPFPAVSLSTRLGDVLANFRKATYSFIVLDLPPITETSISLRIAGYLDSVVVVVDSEKVNRDVGAHVAKLLRDVDAKVCGTVLNKRRTYIPSRLYQEH